MSKTQSVPRVNRKQESRAHRDRQLRRAIRIGAIVVAVLIVGFIFMQRMSVDMFPDVNFPYISVTTVYPGAGPQELETLVTKLLEEQISSISGLKNVTSINQDGVSVVIG
jgi:HAE1 family hydrophobic/amphiphilic exporter-1